MFENGFDVSVKTRADGVQTMSIEIECVRLIGEISHKHAEAIPHNYDSIGKYRSFDKAVVECARSMLVSED